MSVCEHPAQLTEVQRQFPVWDADSCFLWPACWLPALAVHGAVWH